MRKAALYARVSSDLQQKEGTIESQLAELRKQVATAGYILVKEYVDDGYSGARLDRPALDQLREDIKTSAFEAIYFHNADRIARDVTYQTIIIGEILRHKKQLIINGKDYIHNPENKFTLTVLGAVSELERAKLIERSTRGKQYRLQQGQLMSNGCQTFGYQYIKKSPTASASYAVDEKEAKIVRYIFETYANGEIGVRPLARQLKEMGMTGRNKLGQTQLKHILNNEMYTGIRYFNTMKESSLPIDPLARGKRSKREYTDRSQWIGIKIPAIVSKDLFEKARARLEHNRTSYRNATRPQLLSRLVSCGACGARCYAYRRSYLVKNGRQSRLYQRAVYKCNGRQGSCRNPEIDTRILDACVLEMIAETLRDPAALKSNISAFTKRGRIDLSKIEKEQKRLHEKITTLHSQKERILDLYASGNLQREEYMRRVSAYDAEIEALKVRKRELNERAPLFEKPEVIESAIKAYCDVAKDRFQKYVDLGEKRAFVLEYVTKITYRHQKSHDIVRLFGEMPLHHKGADDLRLPFSIERKINRTELLARLQKGDARRGVTDEAQISKMHYADLVTQGIPQV